MNRVVMIERVVGMPAGMGAFARVRRELEHGVHRDIEERATRKAQDRTCLLYTSDAADE